MHMGINAVTLREFLEQYLAQHSLSIRKFAEQVEVSPNTISRWLNEDDPEIDIDNIIKLANATNYDPLLLLEIVYSKRLKSTPRDISARILAARIMRLPDLIRSALEELIDRYFKGG